ncbi:hypothetical protein BH11PLA1_BH11PLA1_19050 [soil metagenome]
MKCAGERDESESASCVRKGKAAAKMHKGIQMMTNHANQNESTNLGARFGVRSVMGEIAALRATQRLQRCLSDEVLECVCDRIMAEPGMRAAAAGTKVAARVRRGSVAARQIGAAPGGARAGVVVVGAYVRAAYAAC